jgi:2-iminobutanoate/2-iminopropanoate deaminase
VTGLCAMCVGPIDEANARMRAKQLGARRVASTVVCCQLLESKWKLEIEAIAAA